jgi:hypothetical protein
MSPKDIAEKKNKNRELVLHHLYEIVNGDSRVPCSAEAFYKSLADRGIPGDDVEEAFTWLQSMRLIEGKFAGHFGLTQSGAAIVEQMDKDRSEGKDPTAQPAVNNVLNFHGPVGGVQTGSNNTMNVKQTVGKSQSSHLDALFQALNSTIATLPKDVQSDAMDVATALESEARSEVPKLPLIKAYVRELKDASVEVSESATDVMNWCVENFCQK